MISNRLKSLTKYINKTDFVIDIGCDHALLDIYLIKNNIIDKCIVSDISINALKQGINNIKKYNLDKCIEIRCGNGLEVLNNNDLVNTVIISGMGTNTILEILNNDYLKKINKLVIQSNKDYYMLRKEIVKLGFIIDLEEVIEDNDKIYINIVFVRGNKEYTEDELLYGINNMLNKEIYYKYLINKKEKILNNLNNLNNIELIEKIKKEIDVLKEKC